MDAIAVVAGNRLRIKIIINNNFSSFYYVALLHSTLANVSMPWSWGWDTMVAAGRWQPPWLGCFRCALMSKTYKCSDSHMEKGIQVKMSTLTCFEPRT